MSFWEKLKPELHKLSVKTNNLSEVLLQDDEYLIPHLLAHLEIDHIKKALTFTNIMVFDESRCEKEQIVKSSGSYLIIKNDDEYLAFSTNPFSALEAFKIRGVLTKARSSIGFIDPSCPFLLNNEKQKEQGIGSKEILRSILQEAIDLGASDIHIRPRNSTHICFKLRIDGMMEDSKAVQDINNTAFQGVAGEINRLFDLDIGSYNNFAAKQSNSGKANVFDDRRKSVDLRMQLNPLHTKFKDGPAKNKHIPNYIIRLMGSTSFRSLDDVGLTDLQVEEIIGFCKYNDSGIFIAGPTGSGKTTLAYAVLAEMHNQRGKSVNILSVEDPVEVDLPDVAQIEIQGDITFEKALKAIKRSDPNIVFCGEIRDKVTAHKVCEIRELGNTILTTIHAGKSFDVVDILRNTSTDESFAIPPDVLAKTVSIIVMPRLVRKVCQHCSTEIEAKDDVLFKRYAHRFDVRATLIRKESEEGCEQCLHTGYKGRIQVAEVFVIDGALKEMIINNESSEKIHASALESQKAKDIFFNAVMLVKKGVTTLNEIARVLPSKVDFGRDYESDHEVCNI
ncbi:hypothetical protein BSPLISOX_1948 [uncultured Gammaproteobacteria bacterium]|jgi:type II secretory ATPase GspE/PulE/Tfp pilus assembly ATPase PilB-like protein|nr:hypothetical protein [uncultured Gammaproteobacteria bacterium]VVH65715.1 hypothetical protein BSPLISOX_1948 [uncultured Gammaproteobacteria bacterium]